MLHACLYTIFFVLCYTSWRFYAFSRTNLLTRCHSASSLFSAIFVFQKSYIGNILRIGRNKSQSSYFSRSVMESKAETEGSQEAATPPHGVGHPQATPGHGVGPWSTSWCRPSAYIFPSMGKPKGPDQFPQNILQATAIVDTRSRGSRSSYWHPVGEGNHRRRPSSSPCLPLEWCVSSLPWTTGP
jgi:hypothetical protein